MGAGEKLNFESASEIFDEMAKVIPQYAGMSFERLGIDGLQWPCKTPEDPGTPILHKEKFRITSYNVCYTKLLREKQ